MACLFAAILALAGCDFAAPDRDWPEPSPAVWEVRDAAGHEGWLFGTVHALPGGLEWRTGTLNEAIGRSGVLVVEIANLGAVDDASAHFGRLSRSEDLPPLLERVPESERTKVAGLLERAGMDEDDLTDIETWGAALILANAVRQYSPAEGVDRALLDQAREVTALESYQSQFAIFDALSAGDQAQLLVSVADETEAGEQDRQIEAWLTGDLATLERQAAGSMLKDPELRDALLVARNRAWADKIARLIATGKRPLVAVGAAHMLTDQGLPALLEAQSFAVTRIQ